MNKEEESVYYTKYRRYGTDSLINILLKIEKYSDLYLYILEILRSRNNNKEYYSKESAIQLEKERNLRVHSLKIHFGNKNEEYFTEKEMINGYKAPKYSELSPEEKKLYNYDDEKFYPDNYFNQ